MNRANSGTLGKNKKKQADTHADYNGQCEVGGTAYWINAWVKEGKDGKFFSLSFREKTAKPNSRQAGDDDSPPF